MISCRGRQFKDKQATSKQQTINQSYNMANNNALATTLALPTSKTNWTATVPARAPPPPPPTKKKLKLNVKKAPKCVKDGCECEAAKNEYYPNSEGGEFWTLCEKCYKEDQEEDDRPFCNDCSGYKCGGLSCYEPVCECDSDDEEEEEETGCEICGATPDITDRQRELAHELSGAEGDDWHGNSVCDECFMCCEVCYDTKNPAVFEKTAATLCECEEKPKCDLCEGAVSDEGGKVTVLGMDITICENCDKGGDNYDGWLDEYDYNPETSNYEEKDAKKEEKLQDEFWNGGMSEMWGRALREGHPLWEPYKLYKAMPSIVAAAAAAQAHMKKEQDEC